MKIFELFSKMSIFEIFCETLRRVTAASFCQILACDTALGSFDIISQDVIILQVTLCAHTSHVTRTHTTKRIFKQNFEISENHRF